MVRPRQGRPEGAPLPDRAIDDAIAELIRLAREVRTRFEQGRHVAAMGSITAMEPLKSLLLEQLGIRWALDADEADDDPAAAPVTAAGYL
jgi:hypothetical protein